jgi:hypothetical protein
MKRVTGLFSGISGKLGDVVYVQRGKTTFIRKLPSKRKSPYTTEELKKQSQFGLASRIAGCICEVWELKHFWKPDKSKNRTSYNQVFRSIQNQFDMMSFSGFIYITPDGGYDLNSKPSLKICESGIEIESDPLKGSDLIDKTKPKYIIAAGIIILKKEVSRFECKYDIMKFRTVNILYNGDSPIRTAIVIKEADLKRWSSYPLKKAFGTFITMGENGCPLRSSPNFQSAL